MNHAVGPGQRRDVGLVRRERQPHQADDEVDHQLDHRQGRVAEHLAGQQVPHRDGGGDDLDDPALLLLDHRRRQLHAEDQGGEVEQEDEHEADRLAPPPPSRRRRAGSPWSPCCRPRAPRPSCRRRRRSRPAPAAVRRPRTTSVSESCSLDSEVELPAVVDRVQPGVDLVLAQRRPPRPPGRRRSTSVTSTLSSTSGAASATAARHGDRVGRGGQGDRLGPLLLPGGEADEADDHAPPSTRCRGGRTCR